MKRKVLITKKTGKPTKLGDILHRFFKNKAAVFGLILLLVIICLACFADVICPYKEAVRIHPRTRLLPPSKEHLFGTDDYGRDMLARVAHGAKYTLLIGVGCSATALIIGGFMGALCALSGGWIDSVFMRVADAVATIPSTLFAMVIVAALGPNLQNLFIALAIGNVPSFMRITKSSVLNIVDQDFVEASRANGGGTIWILLTHIIPNAIGTLIVYTTTAISRLIISAAGLSYIGLGVQPPAPEWGSMLSSCKEFFLTAPHLLIFPAIALLISALGFNLVGDGLRDALDPKLK